MNRAGFALLTGEVGSGKTTLIRQLLARLEADCTRRADLEYAPPFGRLLQWVCLAFGLEYRDKDEPSSTRRSSTSWSSSTRRAGACC